MQTFIGAVIYLTQIRNPHYRCHGAIVTNWHGFGGSLSLGMFIFLDIRNDRPENAAEKALLAHEYGHTVQSLMLGPLYLLVIGLPSVIWAGCFGKYRRRTRCPYDKAYPEKWANLLGSKFPPSVDL